MCVSLPSEKQPEALSSLHLGHAQDTHQKCTLAPFIPYEKPNKANVSSLSAASSLIFLLTMTEVSDKVRVGLFLSVHALLPTQSILYIMEELERRKEDNGNKMIT